MWLCNLFFVSLFIAGYTQGDIPTVNSTELYFTGGYAIREYTTKEYTTKEYTTTEYTTKVNATDEHTKEAYSSKLNTLDEYTIEENTTEVNATDEHTTEEYTIQINPTDDHTIQENTTKVNATYEHTTEDNTTQVNLSDEHTKKEETTKVNPTNEQITEENTTKINATDEQTTEEYMAVENATKLYAAYEHTTKEYSIEEYAIEEYTTNELTTKEDTTEGYSTEDYTTNEYTIEEYTTEEGRLAEGEKKMSEYILKILEHFKDPDPVGLPGFDIPDPLPMPDHDEFISLGTMLYLKDMVMFGTSKLRILNMHADIKGLEVHATMSVDELLTRGNYTVSTWWNSVKGPFTINATGIKGMCKGTLGVERSGKLQAKDIDIDITSETIAFNFQNLGFFGNIIQGFINSAGTAFFDSMKPMMLKEMFSNIRVAVNEQLDKVAGDMQFPNSISSLDMVLIELRKKLQYMNLDPYQIKDYNTTVGIFGVTLSKTWLAGLSSFQSIGNITMKMENNIVVAEFGIGTRKLEGKTQWDIDALSAFMNTTGTASFSVEYITARLVLEQPLDTRQKPVLKHLELDLGNIQMRSEGAGTLDYVIEFAVNVFPNLLRYQILEAIEVLLKIKVQQELDRINMDDIVKYNLPIVDSLQASGFKLSDLKVPETEAHEDDKFFNF